MPEDDPRPTVGLWRFVLEMLLVGATGFGGFLQLRLRQRIVDQLGWLSEDEFVDAVTTASIAPGGPSTALIVELGRRIHGPLASALGLLASLLPGTLVVVALTGAYRAHRDDAAVQGFLRGAAAGGLAMIAVFVAQLWQSFGRRPVDALGALGVLGLAMVGLPLPLVLVLGVAGCTLVIRRLEPAP